MWPGDFFSTLEEILLASPFSDQGNIFWKFSFFFGVWLERNIRIFREVEKSFDEI